MLIHLIAQATQPAITTEGLILRIGLYGAVGAAAVIGAFKLINLFIEQFGSTRKLWREQIQGQINTLGQATSTLIDANKLTNGTPDVKPEIEQKVSDIVTQGTGDGTIKEQK